MMKPSKKSVASAMKRLINAGFEPPHQADPKGMCEEWALCLNGIPDDELDRAMTDVIATRKFWPKPAHIIEAWEDVYFDRWGKRLDQPTGVVQ